VGVQLRALGGCPVVWSSCVVRWVSSCDLPDMALSIASHSIALEATRDSALMAVTLTLRRRHREFIWNELATMFGRGRSDLMALNAAGMVVVGAGLGLHLAGGEIMRPMTLLEHLVFGARASSPPRPGNGPHAGGQYPERPLATRDHGPS
jgi:hypothetical protein